MLKSRHKLTHSPASSPWVVLDYDALILDDIKPVASRITATVPIVRAAAPVVFDGGNTSYQFSVGIISRDVTDAASLTAVMDALIDFAARTVAPLKVELAGVTAYYYLYAECAISRLTPSGRKVGLGQTLREYTFLCSGLTKVTV